MSNPRAPFAIWLTGLPASGKSTLAAAIKSELALHGVNAAILESDVLRRVLTPNPTYDNAERDRFYGQLVSIGALLVSQGVPVIFDATANRRSYRDAARRQIPKFLEVYVECPLETCIARDPKKIYRRVSDGAVTHVPGAQVEYEPPLAPEVIVRGDGEEAQLAARRILDCLWQLTS